MYTPPLVYGYGVKSLIFKMNNVLELIEFRLHRYYNWISMISCFYSLLTHQLKYNSVWSVGDNRHNSSEVVTYENYIQL